MKIKKTLRLSSLACLCLTASLSLCGCQKGNTGANQSRASESKDSALEETSTKKNTLRLDLGEFTALPSIDGTVVSCSSSDDSVVAITSDGNLHAIKHGDATITAGIETEDGANSQTFHVKVRRQGMVYPTFSMMKGEHLDMQFSRKKIQATWISSNPSIASVSKQGKVLAKKKGTATITGTAGNGKTYTCSLTVTRPIENIIYLTFDDGPNRYSTPKILDILAKYDVKATFFELKPAKKDFDLTKRVIDEGHTLALHGYQHKYDIIYKSEKIYRNNLDQLRNLFFQKYGVWCTISRFPGGSSNTCSSYTPGIMTRLTQKLDGWGYHYFDWNVDSGDAGGSHSAGDVFRSFKNGIVKGRGNVVLMHDFYKNDKTINALEKIIHYGKKNGYTFLPITASTAEVHHQVNN